MKVNKNFKKSSYYKNNLLIFKLINFNKLKKDKLNYLLLLTNNKINFNKNLNRNLFIKLKWKSYFKLFFSLNRKKKKLIKKNNVFLKNTLFLKKILKNSKIYKWVRKNKYNNLYLGIKNLKKNLKIKVKKFHLFKKDWFFYIYIFYFIIKSNLLNQLISQKLLINFKLVYKNILKLEVINFFIILAMLKGNKKLKIYIDRLKSFSKLILINILVTKQYIKIIFKYFQIKYTKSLFYNKYRNYYNFTYNPKFKKKFDWRNFSYKFRSKSKYFLVKKLKKGIRYNNFKLKKKNDLKLKKNVLFFYINRTKNNLFITIVNKKKKKILFKLSIGLLKIKNFKKILKYTYEQIGLELNKNFKEKFNFKFINFVIIINGNYSRLIKKIIYNFINSNKNTKFIYNIKGIRDYSPRIHNGCRLKKKRK